MHRKLGFHGRVFSVSLIMLTMGALVAAPYDLHRGTLQATRCVVGMCLGLLGVLYTAYYLAATAESQEDMLFDTSRTRLLQAEPP
eukprot:scaffold547_cov384-Prasinococcus_capsulatus_cf.AAC.27